MRELLPFVIHNYTVGVSCGREGKKREVLIVLSDIIQYVKHTKSQSKKQGQLEEVLVTLIENVEDITEYLENGASDASVSAIDMFMQFLECNTNESHFRVGISKRTHL